MNPVADIDSLHDKLKFRIAGVLLSVSGARALRLRIGNPLYRSFLSRHLQDAGGREIDIRLHTGQFPPAEKMEKIFDTRESWSLFREKNDLRILFRSPRLAEPLWAARFDRRASRVEYYCPPLQPLPGKRTIEMLCPLAYPLDQLLLMYYFARRRGILIHAAGMVHRGQAFIFSGASGAGKSTFSELLVTAGTGKVLSDERMIVREIDGVMQAFGTPWAGTAGIGRSGSAPLAGIFFLKHGKGNCIERLDGAAAADRLLPLSSIPWYDPDTAAPIIAFAKRIFTAVPAYEFRFTPDRSAIDFFWKFIKKTS
ncbi:MAG: hypothetical protein ABII93_06155 [Chrysiogenia bacterium]